VGGRAVGFGGSPPRWSRTVSGRRDDGAGSTSAVVDDGLETNGPDSQQNTRRVEDDNDAGREKKFMENKKCIMYADGR